MRYTYGLTFVAVFHDCGICCTVKITAASTVHFVHNYVFYLCANFDAFIHMLNNSVLLHILATALEPFSSHLCSRRLPEPEPFSSHLCSRRLLEPEPFLAFLL